MDDKNLRLIFGTNLKLKRSLRDLTQEQLAERLEVDVKTISRIESGQSGTEFNTIEKICQTLNISAYELFLPLEDTSGNIDEVQKLLIEVQKVYKQEIERIAKVKNISFESVRVITRSKDASNRFDRNRNQNKDKLAPVRVEALALSFNMLLVKFPHEEPGILWSILQKIYYQMYVGVGFPTTIVDSFISASQSWVKTSGTAFEKIIIDKLTDLYPGVEILKPKKFNELVERKSVINSEKFRKEKKEDDLLVVYSTPDGDKTYLIGVIQTKTSVRDRLKEDPLHSKLMLEAGLWSVHITIDPDDFLSKPKYRGMANIEGIWHGVYKLSSLGSESVGVFDFDKLGQHSPQVVEAVISGQMNSGWRPRMV